MFGCVNTKFIRLVRKESGDTIGRRNAQANINALRDRYTKISEAAGLREQPERAAVGGFRAVKTLDQLKKRPFDGIIEETRALIRSGTVLKTINPEKQGRHIKDAPEYTPGRSYILGDVDAAQALVDKYHGTGTPMFDKNGKWKNKEVVKSLEAIGYSVDPKSLEEQLTNRFVIHYSNTGAHVVPTRMED